MENYKHDRHLSQPDGVIIQQELVTYSRDENGNVRRETVTRDFFGSSDYQDSTSVTILKAKA
jgi:hypothetical protein